MSKRGSFRSRCRAQASTVGVALVIGMTLLGATTVVALGSVAYDDGQRQSEVERAEQSMAQFDSRTAQVALGEDAAQRLTFGRSEGTYTVDPDAGRIEIEHVEYDGSNNETIYNESLGSVDYRSGDEKIAYQGGGVWRKTGDGRARMVSPPEFHYRAATLTLPIVLVRGTASAGGAPTAVIEQRQATVAKYPNASATYEGSDREYRNPAEGGSIRVTVTGEYYRGWANYFDERTDGTVVTINDSAQRVTAKLITLGNQGEFDIPTDDGTGEVKIRGLQDGGLNELNFTLRPDNPDADKFSSIDWSLYVEEGDRRLEMNIGGASNGECGDTVDLTVYYTDNGGDTYHGWVAEDAYAVTCKDYDGDGDDEAGIEVSLTDSSISADYSSLSGKLAQYNPGSGGGSLAEPIAFDEFDSDPNETYTEGDNETIDVITNHYFSRLGPRFNLLAADGNRGNTVSESDSTGDDIQYTGNDVITYLHVSENEIEVSFE